MRPLISENYDVQGDPADTVEIVEVPIPNDEGATLSLADLALHLDADGLTVSADAVGDGSVSNQQPGGDQADSLVSESPAPQDLDVRERMADLLGILRDEATGPVTVEEAHALAGEHGGDALDVAPRSIRNYLRELVEAGAVEKIEHTPANQADEYRLR